VNIIDKTKKDKSFGIIPVFRDSKGDFVFCLVRHAGEHWGFPKGHQEISESEQETATRELKEETGINNVDLLNSKLFVENYSFEKDNFKHNKSVKYFLGFVFSIATKTPDNFKKEISELKWVSYEEAKELITFPGAREILDQAFEYLQTVTGVLKI
jgi:8-oxo-dGTP pyrophosphatase MutT (NUDIX family)